MPPRLGKLGIDKDADKPAYRQIADRVVELVRTGALAAGDRLPTERDLAAELGLARGTVKKAYEELARLGVATAAQGRGSFVAAARKAGGRKERAQRLIAGLLGELEALRFSSQEIRTLVDVALAERGEDLRRSSVAAVDCNPEALRAIGRQLGRYPNLTLTSILLDDLRSDPGIVGRLEAFDLVLCTATHREEVIGTLPGAADRVAAIVLNPTQDTIVSLAGIRSTDRVGIACESRRFLEIVSDRLAGLGVAAAGQRVGAPPLSLSDFVEDLDVLILPPEFAMDLGREKKAAVQAFTERGGRIVRFDYRIEEGSLLYLEARIKALSESQEGAG